MKGAKRNKEKASEETVEGLKEWSSLKTKNKISMKIKYYIACMKTTYASNSSAEDLTLYQQEDNNNNVFINFPVIPRYLKRGATNTEHRLIKMY